MTIIDVIKNGLMFKYWSIEKLPKHYLDIKELSWLEGNVEELMEYLSGEYEILVERYHENGLFGGVILLAMGKSGEILYSRMVMIS